MVLCLGKYLEKPRWAWKIAIYSWSEKKRKLQRGRWAVLHCEIKGIVVFPGLPREIRWGLRVKRLHRRETTAWLEHMSHVGLYGGHTSRKFPMLWDRFTRVLVKFDIDIKAVSDIMLYFSLVTPGNDYLQTIQWQKFMSVIT